MIGYDEHGIVVMPPVNLVGKKLISFASNFNSFWNLGWYPYEYRNIKRDKMEERWVYLDLNEEEVVTIQRFMFNGKIYEFR